MRFFQFVFRFRWPIVLGTVLLTLILAWPISRLKINADLTSYLPRTDTAVKTLEYIADTYGGNFVAVIAFESEDVFQPSTLEALRQLTSQLQLLEGVNYVTSLTNVLDLKKSEEGLEIGKLIRDEDFPIDEAKAKELREYVLAKKRFRGRLVSADGRVALLIVALRKDVDKNKVMEEIEKIIEASRLPGEVRLAGLPAQLREISRFIINDLKTLLPLMITVVFLCLFLSFRSWRGVFLPLVTVAISTLWTLGVMSLAKVPLTIISDAIPVLLLAIGSAYSIHILNRFDEAPGGEKEKALAHVSASVFLAAVTTIAGFISFIFGSYLTAIREFGLFASIGILFSLLLSLTFGPALLFIIQSRWPEKKRSSSKNRRASNSLLLRFEKWSFSFLRQEKITLLIFLLIIGIAIGGIPQIKRHSKMLDYFEPTSEIRRSEDFLEKRFGGSIPISILVRGDIQDPAVLREMKALEEFLEAEPFVHNPLSIADYLAEMNDLMGEGEVIPDTREKVSNLLFLLEGQEGLDQILHPDKKEAIIQATIPSLDMGEMQELVNRLESWIKQRSFKGAQMEFSGSPLVYLHLDRSLIQSQLVSLAIALGLIYLCVLFLVRSPFGAWLGMIPIIFTLILVFGFMGYAGIPLDIATVLVGSVSIGIGIDYALHWINRFRLELFSSLSSTPQFSSAADLRDSATERKFISDSGVLIEAAEKTLRSTGRAITINMVTVALGFLILVLGNLIPLRRFGLLVALTMLSSGLGALTLLPAVVVRTKAKWLKTIEAYFEKTNKSK
ncbi:MAG: efflux RND transporter permease subunit [Candidatus Aminicenantes bacterium]|nr:efflux RND transporter permease subunit [Candidatus Aminicenantes bacterium]